MPNLTQNLHERFLFVKFSCLSLRMISKDILWKGIIEDLFDDLLWYFLPDLAQNEVDFSKGF